MRRQMDCWQGGTITRGNICTALSISRSLFSRTWQIVREESTCCGRLITSVNKTANGSMARSDMCMPQGPRLKTGLWPPTWWHQVIRTFEVFKNMQFRLYILPNWQFANIILAMIESYTCCPL